MSWSFWLISSWLVSSERLTPSEDSARPSHMLCCRFRAVCCWLRSIRLAAGKWPSVSSPCDHPTCVTMYLFFAALRFRLSGRAFKWKEEVWTKDQPYQPYCWKIQQAKEKPNTRPSPPKSVPAGTTNWPCRPTYHFFQSCSLNGGQSL